MCGADASSDNLNVEMSLNLSRFLMCAYQDIWATFGADEA